MRVDLDLAGRTVLVVGGPAATRRVRAGVEAAGGTALVLPASEAVTLLRPSAEPPAGPAADLVVWVEGPERDRELVRSSARSARVPVTTAPPAGDRGRVTLVGGGPGHADLLTVAGRDALAAADVVLYDRLGPHDRLAELAPGAELVDVGKTPGHHAVPQREIERLLVGHALAGAHVVRLKGGDPFVFGRGSEEVAACRAAGVDVHVIPGVTSAVAVPGAAGIPVTHRGLSRSFTVVSGHVPFDEEEYAHLRGVGGTLVVLMGVNTLTQVAAGLVRAGMDAAMPLAVVERGFLPGQRTRITTVGAVCSRGGPPGVSSPAVVVVGEVVRLAGPDGVAELAVAVGACV
ncbi:MULTISPECIES: uroporphyrinogen-III C-methyltransferase [Ornithinimicrobium]|uniref:uroporphyrinogen-III C-methyltransferase n=1 Tax=Ornithinimicrobium tianjinense TaxID=1195761 RepID=A0A917BWJ6_9MICO|nr:MULTISPECIES: uroporphyrinogen-III C-methyltransferase [Ornithinimicrobium]GGF57475.1 hypothetical protein GCM10011366_26660 [Ornithinimicrobium tianjinense]